MAPGQSQQDNNPSTGYKLKKYLGHRGPFIGYKFCQCFQSLGNKNLYIVVTSLVAIMGTHNKYWNTYNCSHSLNNNLTCCLLSVSGLFSRKFTVMFVYNMFRLCVSCVVRVLQKNDQHIYTATACLLVSRISLCAFMNELEVGQINTSRCEYQNMHRQEHV